METTKEKIHVTTQKIIGIKFNTELAELIQQLQLYRGYSLLASKVPQVKSKQLEPIKKSLSHHIARLDAIVSKTDKKALSAEWIELENALQSLKNQNSKGDVVQTFESNTLLIKHIMHLVEQNQYSFELINQNDLAHYALNTLLFTHLPILIEDLGYIRALSSYSLSLKEAYNKSISLRIKQHLFMIKEELQHLNELKKLIPSLPHVNEINVGSSYFEQLDAMLQHKVHSIPALKFFEQNSAQINRLHKIHTTLYHYYLNSEKAELKHLKETYYKIMGLIFIMLSLALYFFLAIFSLNRKNIRNLLLATDRLVNEVYSKSCEHISNDEFSIIAQRIDKLGARLANDHEIIDKYVLISKTDLKGNITFVTSAFCQLTGFAPHELIGKNHNLLRHPENKDAFFKAMWETILSGKIWEGELKNQTKEGETFWIYLYIIPILDDKGKPYRFTSVRKDITAKKITEILATKDSLTGLFNRKYLHDMLLLEMEKAKRYNQIFALIMIDIDHFKQINDTYGHQEGDSVLKRFSELIGKSLRKSDTFARWGGEEFIILLPHTDIQTATQLAMSLRKLVETYCHSHKHASTISIGVTEFEPLEDSQERMLKRLDMLLYKAKNQGRNRVVSSIDTAISE